MTNVQVRAASHGQYINEAATIWAETTAARDGEAEIAPLGLARPPHSGSSRQLTQVTAVGRAQR
ncbi:MAG TPA: hypothetical protein VFX60_05640 [Micromonospora sp.]|nr:hypothetical protein [Micromonospora sp.]